MFTPTDIAVVSRNFDEDMVTCGASVSHEAGPDIKDIFHPDSCRINIYVCYFTHVLLSFLAVKLKRMAP